MLSIAKADGVIREVPVFAKLQEAESRQGLLEQRQSDDLLPRLPGRLHPLAVCRSPTGVREGEAQKIDWTQVDLERDEIVMLRDQTKNDKKRILVICSQLPARLEAIPN